MLPYCTQKGQFAYIERPKLCTILAKIAYNFGLSECNRVTSCFQNINIFIEILSFVSGTMPLPPPTFPPPPPPPPIEDIPNRGGLTAQQQQQHFQQQHQRQFQFGPQIRGNYSDVEQLRRNYPEHENVRRQYSEPECTCRGNPCSEGDLSEFEPHYLVQTPTGNVLIPQSQGKDRLRPILAKISKLVNPAKHQWQHSCQLKNT